jgi:hypothetical protein
MTSTPEGKKSPFVHQLLAFIDHQDCIIQQQNKQIQQLKNEIAHIKKQPPRPKIKPSRLGKKESKSAKGKKPGPEKRHKTSELVIHKEKPIEQEYIPPRSVLRLL